MRIHYLVIILILADSYLVLTYNSVLTNVETNLLYKHIKTRADFDFFYQKIIDSNSINSATVMQNVHDENGNGKQSIEHKVNIISYVFSKQFHLVHAFHCC